MLAVSATEAMFVPAEVIGELSPVLEDPASPSTCTMPSRPFMRCSITTSTCMGIAFDTALAAYVVNPSLRDYGLSDLAGRLLSLELEPVDDQGEPVHPGHARLR